MSKRRIAIIGGGPSALFVYKRLVEAKQADLSVDIFERKQRLGLGMPYSSEGANLEHITNVSGNELPDLPDGLTDWVRTLPEATLEELAMDPQLFTEEKVLPRLLFGRYLEAQFKRLLEQKAVVTTVHFGSEVVDLRDLPESGRMAVVLADGQELVFDLVVVCTGHKWPTGLEGKVEGYYDSPYPPSKLARRLNHPVAIRGSSLTAVDAVRTLSRHNGRFVREAPDSCVFEPAEGCEKFKLVMHTRNGMLPCVRFHLDDPHVSDEGLLQPEDLERARAQHDGFVPLDLVFEEDFKKLLAEKDPALYERVRSLSLEEFVDRKMDPRERSDPFDYFKAECDEALRSLNRRESIAWKEALAILSFAVNYPAKHFSAEDMLRLRQVLMPLISVVIAFIPQSSCEELLALYEAGCLELIAVGSDGGVEVSPAGEIVYRFTDEDGRDKSLRYSTYIDCVGQPHLPVEAFPFKSLIDQGVVRQARLTFRSDQSALEQLERDRESVVRDDDGSYHLIVPGIAINDAYQPVAWDGKANPRLYLMAVPYIGGHNPDYSGLDFCEEASKRIVTAMLS